MNEIQTEVVNVKNKNYKLKIGIENIQNIVKYGNYL